MTVARTQLKKNVGGYFDGYVFHPIRSSKGYDGSLAGDNDDVFDREIRREKNKTKAIENWMKAEERRQIEEMKSEQTRKSLLQFVRSSGGLYFDEKDKRGHDYGELQMLSFKETKKRGIAHKNGKYYLGEMVEQVREAGFPIHNANELLDALDNEIRTGKKVYATLGVFGAEENPARYNAWTRKARSATQKRNPKKVMKKSVRQTAKGLARLFKGLSVSSVIEHLDKLAAKSGAKKNPSVKINPAKAEKVNEFWQVKLSDGSFLKTYEGKSWKTRSQKSARELAATLNLNNADEQAWLDYLRQEVKQGQYKRLKAVKNPSPLAMLNFAANALNGALAGLLIHKEVTNSKTKAKTRRTAKKNPPRPLNSAYQPRERETVHHKNVDKFLSQIEEGKETPALVQHIRHQGKLAGYDTAEINDALQYARIAWKLELMNRKMDAEKSAKKAHAAPQRRAYQPTFAFNPSTCKTAQSLVKNAETILKTNGFIKRAIARQRAGSALKRQLRLQYKIDRTKSKLSDFSRKAMENPAKVLQFPKKQKEPYFYLRIGHYGENYLHTDQTLKGQGIRLLDDGKDHSKGYKKYQITDRALAKIENSHKVHFDSPEFSPFNSNPKKTEKVRTKAKKATSRTKKNPSIPKRPVFEMFHGYPATTVKEMPVSSLAPKSLDQLGDLKEIILTDGTALEFGKKFKLCASPRGSRLWIAGGRIASPNPALSEGQLDVIGEIDDGIYGTFKPHLGDNRYTFYIHKLGEETGEKPLLCVDREGFPVIHGGAYTIEDRGIVN